MVEYHQEPADFDNTWKEMLDDFLPWFIQMFFPDMYDDINWDKRYESLEQELRQIVPEAETGKRYVDKLIRLYRRNNEEALVYIHIEVQSQPDISMPERIYVYNCLLFLKHKNPVMSLVVLGDPQPDWRPSKFAYELWGSKVSIEFQTLKLLDFQDKIAELQQSGNPFGLFVVAHLRTLETKTNPQQRMSYKEEIAKALLDLGLSNHEIYLLVKFIDAMMTLPRGLEQEFLHSIHSYQEEKKMPVVAPFEQIAMEKGLELGIQQGIEKGLKQGMKKGKELGEKKGLQHGEIIGSLNEAQTSLLDILEARLGALSSQHTGMIKKLDDISILRQLRKQAISVSSIDEFQFLLINPNDGEQH